MAVGTSLLLIAVGAILALAVDYEVTGIDIETVGIILIVVGALGLVLSLLFMASMYPFGRGDRSHVNRGGRDDF